MAAIAITALIVLTSHFAWVLTARAAAISQVKDTMSTALPSTAANHVIQFVSPTGAAESTDTITIQFDPSGTSFNLTGVIEDDIDIEHGSSGTCSSATFTDRATAGSAASDVWGVAINTSTDTITFTHPTNNGSSEGLTAGRCIQIVIGTTAGGSGTGVNQITSPAKSAAAGTADIYTVAVAGAFGDSGDMLVAIQDGVTVTATVDESLTFTIAGVASGSCTGDTGSPTAITTTATTVPFATLTIGTFKVGCHDLTISTNAANGYTVSAVESTSLITNTGYTLDDATCNGACTHTSGEAWTSTTSSGFGYYCEETGSISTDCDNSGDSTSEYRRFACAGSDAQCDPSSGAQTAVSVITYTAPVNGEASRIHYKIVANATQEAGSYSTTVTYVATPTF